MDELDPTTMYELCFPGALTGSTEVTCPHCGELLTMDVGNPMGVYELSYCACGGEFIVGLAEGTAE